MKQIILNNILNLAKNTITKTLLGLSISLFFISIILFLTEVLKIDLTFIGFFIPEIYQKETYNQNDVIGFVIFLIFTISFILYFIKNLLKKNFPSLFKKKISYSNIKLNFILHLISYFIFLIDIYKTNNGLDIEFIFIIGFFYIIAFIFSSIYIKIGKISKNIKVISN